MTMGIGGAGSKLAILYDGEATIVNVSEAELSKLPAKNRILAVVHSATGQLRGSRKNPQIGREAFLSIKREMLAQICGNLVFSSTGGGTGNGITASLLDDLAHRETVPAGEKTAFVLLLPYAKLEPAEFIDNTIGFLRGPLSQAIDSGNTGNIFLFTNRLKFESKLSEQDYNAALIESLKVFMAIPRKGESFRLLDGHVDYEDFDLYLSKPYFNHFTYFHYDPEVDFQKQLEANLNPYLLPPEKPIEALFLLEVPAGGDPTLFYDILSHFAKDNVTPVYSVVENPELDKPFVTVSLLYSRKPAELVDDFNRVSHAHTQAKVRKSLEQHVPLPVLRVSLESEAKRQGKQQGADEAEILTVLRRLGKL